MNFKKNQGFTLVELIVVIAILGLLAGIGIPMYSGYVEKADKAVEVQNITMFHNAFVVACVSNEMDPATYPVRANWDTNGAFIGLQENVTRSAATTESSVEGDFNAYFGFPDVAYEFKHHTQEEVVAGIQNGISTDGSGSGSDGGVFSTIFNSFKDNETFQNAVTNLNNSTFGTIGAKDLMNKVDTVTGLAAGLAGVNNNFATSLAGSMATLAESLGYDMDDEEDAAAFETYFAGLIDKKAAELYPDDPTSAASLNAARNELLANYAVLAAAQNTTGTKTEMLNNLKGGMTVTDIKNMMDKNASAETQQQGMANAAMMYAMYTAYANSLPSETEEQKTAKENALSITGDISTFVTTMANQESAQYTGFQNYLGQATGDGTSQAEKDLDGYLGALNIINTSVQGNEDAVTDVLMNGYNNEDLIVALGNLMGSSN